MLDGFNVHSTALKLILFLGTWYKYKVVDLANQHSTLQNFYGYALLDGLLY